MTHVVTSKCVICVHAPCLDVCPMVSFRTNGERMVIDPDECIDCTMCASECEESAIYSDEELPPSEMEQFDLNYNYAKEWPVASLDD